MDPVFPFFYSPNPLIFKKLFKLDIVYQIQSGDFLQSYSVHMRYLRM